MLILAGEQVTKVLMWSHIDMQGHVCANNVASCTSGNSITSCKASLISFSSAQKFHLDFQDWNEPRPPESPLTPSPLFLTPEKSTRGAQMKLGRRAAPCASVANFQNSLTPPPHAWKVMGSFWFGYGDSTVREPPSGFLLTWVRCEPVVTAR